jgi:predicted nucleotidyltransferase
MKIVTGFIPDLRAAGYAPERVVLFGSYAKGRPHPLSDIDLAVWDQHFVGGGTADIAPFAHLVSKYPGLEVHTFVLEDTATNNPFAGDVLRSGGALPLV